MWGLGKKRSRLGRWLDSKGYTQEDLTKASRVNRNTVSKLCSDPDYLPTGSTMKRIIKALKEIDPNVKADKFWDI